MACAAGQFDRAIAVAKRSRLRNRRRAGREVAQHVRERPRRLRRLYQAFGQRRERPRRIAAQALRRTRAGCVRGLRFRPDAKVDRGDFDADCVAVHPSGDGHRDPEHDDCRQDEIPQHASRFAARQELAQSLDFPDFRLGGIRFEGAAKLAYRLREAFTAVRPKTFHQIGKDRRFFFVDVGDGRIAQLLDPLVEVRVVDCLPAARRFRRAARRPRPSRDKAGPNGLFVRPAPASPDRSGSPRSHYEWRAPS